MKVYRTSTTVTGSAMNLYIIDKIGSVYSHFN
jgi:hypothetical protein